MQMKCTTCGGLLRPQTKKIAATHTKPHDAYYYSWCCTKCNDIFHSPIKNATFGFTTEAHRRSRLREKDSGKREYDS